MRAAAASRSYSVRRCSKPGPNSPQYAPGAAAYENDASYLAQETPVPTVAPLLAPAPW